MKAGADMKIAGKTLCVFVLLTITKVMRTVGNTRPTATVGDNFVLTCTPQSSITMLTWKIRPKVGGPCTLGYRADHNQTHTNCTGSVNWKFSPNQNPVLEIQQVGAAHEGNYTCETVVTDGNFVATYYLTVLAPPMLALYCDDQGNPVCKAAAGKPAAQLLWEPGGNFTLAAEGHDDGTVTVVSKLTAHSANGTNNTCVVFHPAGNQTKSIACHPSNTIVYLTVSITLCLLSIIVVAIVCCFKFYSDRLCHKTKPPETAPTHSSQDDSMEVEPYTTYVQKENVIYNSVSDLTAGHNFPQCLTPGT